MEYLYGDFSETQMHDYKKYLHIRIHNMLKYKEKECPTLDGYITNLLYYIAGLNTVFGEPPEIVSLIAVIQSIKDENKKEKDCDFRKYRSLVFDAHSLVDLLREV